MQFLTKDKQFYMQLLTIAVPIALQNLLNFSVSMADTVMLGMLGEVYLSSASLANQIGFIYGLFTFGVGGGSNVMIAQFWGKGDVQSIHKVITLMYRILFVGGIFFTVIALFFSRQAMMVFTTDSRVIEEGSRFLRIVGFSYILMGISSTTVIMLRSVGAVKIAILVYISSLLTNVFFNWMLIFGNLGAPALKIQGAAIATCMSRVVEIIIVFVYMFRVEKKIGYKIKYLFITKISMLREFVKNAGPVVVNELLWGLGSATIAVIIGRMGMEFTAANS
ncbi:MAG: polysaccharide biosynthesis C-terminal domain-containing protein, partial [Oscillospiraceae bacterium]|nr:polysaccharide biosynthesis C-terminal domain-containing protein [Oscillospiraceae bacterium]